MDKRYIRTILSLGLSCPPEVGSCGCFGAGMVGGLYLSLIASGYEREDAVQFLFDVLPEDEKRHASLILSALQEGI